MIVEGPNINLSTIRLEHPITFVGIPPVLSVEIATNFLTPFSTDRSARSLVPGCSQTHRFPDDYIHHRHMLVGSRVENHLVAAPENGYLFDLYWYIGQKVIT